MMRILKVATVVAISFAATACGTPGEPSLRDSFAQQLAGNKFVKEFQRSGDDLTFTGPGAEGGVAKWRVHIDSATIEPNKDEAQPNLTYKGTVVSSWYSDGQIVRPSATDSNLPIELTSNGLSNGDCWAFWDSTKKQWNWE